MKSPEVLPRRFGGVFFLLAVLLLLASCGPRDPQEAKLKEFAKEPAALLILDMQNVYLPVYRQSILIQTIAKLRISADEAGIPVVYIRQTSAGLPADSKSLAIHPALKPREGETVIDKERPSAFYNTNLEEVLLFQNIKTLIVTGIATPHCYAATVIDGASRGFNIIIPEKGHSTAEPNAKTLIEAYNARWAEKENMAVVPAERITIKKQ